MSRRKRNKRNRNNPGGNPVYFQSSAMNQAYYNFFYNQILKLALARFRWVNLPDTCDPRFLELTLLSYGVATIAKAPGGGIVSLRCVQTGTPNMYGNPVTWIAQGVNGSSFNCTHANAGIVWDNMERVPLISEITALAWDMSDIVRTKHVNRVHVKVPFILSGPPELREQLVNLFSQMAGNEPAIITNDSLSSYVSTETQLLKTGVEYIGHELNEDLMETWNMVYTMLGIRNLPFKMERQTAYEIRSYDQPTELTTVGSLEARKAELKHINKMFGTNIDVVWNEDFESVNYNTMHNIERFAKVVDAIGDDTDGRNGVI